MDFPVPSLSGADVARSFAALPAAVLVTDAQGQIVHLNDAFERLTGFESSELVGRNCRELQGPGTDRSTVSAIRAALSDRRSFRGEILNYRSSGEAFWNLLVISPLLDDAGAVTGFVSVQSDVTSDVEARRRHAEQVKTAELLLAVAPQLTAQNSLVVARALVDGVVGAGASRAAFAVVQPDTRLRVSATSGWMPTPSLENGIREILEAPEFKQASVDFDAVWVERGSARPETAAHMDALGAARLAIVPMRGGAGVRGALVGFWDDPAADSLLDDLAIERMTKLADLGDLALDNLELIDQIRSAAERDHLTGLAARSVVQARLEQALAAQSGTAAAIYLDVDRFKGINDSLGHAGGDELLAQIATRIRTAVGGAGTVGRPGGDEFVVVLPGADEARAAEVSSRIATMMAAPFTIGRRTIYARASSGYSIGRAGRSESPADAATGLIQAADKAMYLAKARSRTRRRVETSLDTVILEADLHRALDRAEISTHFQPQFDGRDGRLAGFEALVRWNHSTFGPIPPALFIPLAAETGVLADLGERVLRDAFVFADAATRRYGALEVGVNVSKYELLTTGFVDLVGSLLGLHPDRAWSLSIEVAETELMGGSGVRRVLKGLRSLGIHIAIDDFGSGFSSLKTLQDLPVSSIKIDETFLRRTGALGGGMIAAIVSLGLGLGLEVMAGGVESDDQLDALRRLGCGRVQGYLLSPALPAAEALLVPADIESALGHRR